MSPSDVVPGMRCLLRRRYCCLQLAAVALLGTFSVHVLWSPPQKLDGARLRPLRLIPAHPSPPPPPPPASASAQDEDCPGLNATTAAAAGEAGVSWVPVPSPQLGESGPYRIIYDWVAAAERAVGNHSVTLCTHATADSAAQHAALLADAWVAPVSMAAFVLPEEVCALAARLAHLRRCSAVFRSHVSVHLVYDRQWAPALNRLPAVDAMEADCARPPPPAEPSRRRQLGLPYPVNVGRNAARRAASTHFVLVSDAELVPSPGTVDMFLKMMERRRNEQMEQRLSTATNRQVYVLPVFEVQSRLPTNKADLVKMLRSSEAVWFHRHVCPHCQKFPGVTQYPNRPFTPGRLQAFSVVKREVPFHRWEPIYIGTSAEPLYDERLSWEGKQDKMTQMTELCLRGYRLVILNQAFLTHVPQPGGIRRQPGFTDATAAWRAGFVKQNQRVYDSIIRGFRLNYGVGGDNRKCMTR